MDWRELPKIDAHIHLLPREVHEANPDADDEFSHAKQETHIALMERYHIEQAVIMTFNDPFLMSMRFTADAVHQNLTEMCKACPGRYFAAADIDWPCSRSVAAPDIYERYFDILSQMDFSEAEARQIAYENAKTVYRLP